MPVSDTGDFPPRRFVRSAIGEPNRRASLAGCMASLDGSALPDLDWTKGPIDLGLVQR